MAELRTTLHCSRQTANRLKEMKKQLNCRSQEELLNELLDKLSDTKDSGESPQKRSKGTDDAEEEEKHLNNLQSVGLLSYAILKDRGSNLDWLTGLNQECREWVFKHLKEAV